MPQLIATFNKPVTFDEIVDGDFECVLVTDEPTVGRIGIGIATIRKSGDDYILVVSESGVNPYVTLSEDGLGLYAREPSDVVIIVGASCLGNKVNYSPFTGGALLDPHFLAGFTDRDYKVYLNAQGNSASIYYDIDAQNAMIVKVWSAYRGGFSWQKILLSADWDDRDIGYLYESEISKLLTCIEAIYYSSDSPSINLVQGDDQGTVVTEQFNIFTGRHSVIPPLPQLTASFANGGDILCANGAQDIISFNRPVTESELIDIQLAYMDFNNGAMNNGCLGRIHRDPVGDLYLVNANYVTSTILKLELREDRMVISIIDSPVYPAWLFALKLGLTPYREYHPLSNPTLLINLPVEGQLRIIALALDSSLPYIRIFSDDGTTGGDIAYLDSNDEYDYATMIMEDGVNRQGLTMGSIVAFLELFANSYYGEVESVNIGSFPDSGITVEDITTTYDLRTGIVAPLA